MKIYILQIKSQFLPVAALILGKMEVRDGQDFYSFSCFDIIWYNIKVAQKEEN